jgi:hypothetical protein
MTSHVAAAKRPKQINICSLLLSSAVLFTRLYVRLRGIGGKLVRIRKEAEKGKGKGSPFIGY